MVGGTGLQLRMSWFFLFFYSAVWYASLYSPRHPPDQARPGQTDYTHSFVSCICRKYAGASMMLVVSICIAMSGYKVTKGLFSSLQ